MVTTITSTSLDFNSIKNKLKVSLENSGEFNDYNFSSSGLSSILDVLAYNTHFNGLTANFALNESFLSTAQLRGSVVSLAEGIGYVPNSKNSSEAIINISVNLSSVSPRPTTIQISENFKFNTTVDEINYTFQTRESLSATDAGDGIYVFKDAAGKPEIKIVEGKSRTKTFVTLKSEDNPIYVIPDKNIDISSAIVRVYDNTSTTAFTTYSNLVNARVINENSTLYILRESPNGFFELSFGNGTTLGKAPLIGGKIEIEYLSVAGTLSNTANVFSPLNTIVVNGTGYPVTVATQTSAVGGSSKESIESIRKNAPFQYASQNRMVTASDYSSLILKNYSSFIDDIQSFGGEDALEPEYGAVFVSILFNTDDTLIQQSIKDEILQLSDELSVASFSVKFDDPIKTFIEVKTFFQFNDNLTTLSRNAIQSDVNSAITGYFVKNTGKFNQSFRRSNVLSLVDATSPAVLSSRQEIKMQRRFTPIPNTIQDHKLRYAAPLATPDDVNYIITSNSFSINGNSCILRNKLNTNKLEVFDSVANSVVVDNVGDYAQDTVNIVGLQIDSTIGAQPFIKLSATPANQSAISPLRQDVIEIDQDSSFTSIVDVVEGVLA